MRSRTSSWPADFALRLEPRGGFDFDLAMDDCFQELCWS
jgi:hypothetical protein